MVLLEEFERKPKAEQAFEEFRLGRKRAETVNRRWTVRPRGQVRLSFAGGHRLVPFEGWTEPLMKAGEGDEGS